MVIHEATISFDGSESKMTLSNLDANEFKGKKGIIKFEDAVKEELRIRSETRSPMLFNLDSIQELAFEDITPELTPVLQNRFRKNKNNLGMGLKNDGLVLENGEDSPEKFQTKCQSMQEIFNLE